MPAGVHGYLSLLPVGTSREQGGLTRQLPPSSLRNGAFTLATVKGRMQPLAARLSQIRLHHTPEILGEACPCQSLRAHAGPFGRDEALPSPTSSASSPGRQSHITEGQATGLLYNPRHALPQSDAGLVWGSQPANLQGCHLLESWLMGVTRPWQFLVKARLKSYNVPDPS